MVFVILFLLLTGYALTAYGFKFWPFTKNQFTEATEEQKTAGNNIKGAEIGRASCRERV